MSPAVKWWPLLLVACGAWIWRRPSRAASGAAGEDARRRAAFAVPRSRGAA